MENKDVVGWLQVSLEERFGGSGSRPSILLKSSLDLGKIQTILKDKGVYSLQELDDDGFIVALGLDPENYRDPTDPTGYDCIKALGDIASTVWADYLDDAPAASP